MPKHQWVNSEWDILEAMYQYGGSFVKQLSVLYRMGDLENKRKLAEAFEHYFKQYDEMATHTTRINK